MPRHLLGDIAPDQLAKAGTATCMFVVRDNHQHRNDIEDHYRHAIRNAKKRLYIANAYFFPGYRFIRELRRAARRGSTPSKRCGSSRISRLY